MMQVNLIEYLACPYDHYSPLPLKVKRQSSDGDIQVGELQCPACASIFHIKESIPQFAIPPTKGGAIDEVVHWKAEEQKWRDIEATQYDNRISDAELSVELNGFTKQLKLENHHFLLDLGCGTGRSTLILAKQAKMTIGIDFSFASLKVFEKRIPQEEKHRFHLVQGDVFHLPFRKQKFNRIASHSVLEHLPGLIENNNPLVEAARVLQNGGLFVLSIYNYSLLRVFLAYVFPFLTYGEGYRREGFHDGKVYYRRFHWRELKSLVETAFDIVNLGGIRIVPKCILKRGGKAVRNVEYFLQNLSISKSLGYFILATGKKKKNNGN